MSCVPYTAFIAIGGQPRLGWLVKHARLWCLLRHMCTKSWVVQCPLHGHWHWPTAWPLAESLQEFYVQVREITQNTAYVHINGALHVYASSKVSRTKFAKGLLTATTLEATQLAQGGLARCSDKKKCGQLCFELQQVSELTRVVHLK